MNVSYQQDLIRLTTARSRKDFFQALAKASPQKNSLTEMILSWIDQNQQSFKIHNVFELHWVQIRIAKFFPEAKISKIKDKISRVFSKIATQANLPNLLDNLNYLSLLVSLIPHNQRHEATLGIVKLSQEKGFDNFFPLIRSFVAKLPEEQRLQAIGPLNSLIKNCSPDTNFGFLSCLPETAELKILKEVANVLENVPDKDLKEEMLLAAYFINPKYIARFMNLIASFESIPSTIPEMLFQAYSIDANLAASSHIHLENRLQNSQSAFELAGYLNKHRKKLLIDQNSRLMDKIINQFTGLIAQIFASREKTCVS